VFLQLALRDAAKTLSRFRVVQLALRDAAKTLSRFRVVQLALRDAAKWLSPFWDGRISNQRNMRAAAGG
jgi:uncharacterized protein (DUF1778 family)